MREVRGCDFPCGRWVTEDCALVKTRETVARRAEGSRARRRVPAEGGVDLLPHPAHPVHREPDDHSAGWLQWTSKF